VLHYGCPGSTISEGRFDPPAHSMSEQKLKIDLYIVVADDDPDDHQLIKDALKECNQNHIVTSVYNGEQLLDLLNNTGFYKRELLRDPDMIILDMRMPILSGMDVLKIIKSSEKLKHIPVFILSEMNMKHDVQTAMNLGIEDFFLKPLKYEALRDLMGEVCKRTTGRTPRA